MEPTINQPVDVASLLLKVDGFKVADKGKLSKHTLVVGEGGVLKVEQIGPLDRIRAGLNLGQASRKAILNVVAHQDPKSMGQVYKFFGVTAKLDKAIEKAKHGNFSGVVRVLKNIDVGTDSDVKVAPIVDKLADALLLAGEKRRKTVDKLFTDDVQKKILKYAAREGMTGKVEELISKLPVLNSLDSAGIALEAAAASGNGDIIEKLRFRWNFQDTLYLQNALAVAKNPTIRAQLNQLNTSSSISKGEPVGVSKLRGAPVPTITPPTPMPRTNQLREQFLQAVSAGNVDVVRELGASGGFLNKECMEQALEDAMSRKNGPMVKTLISLFEGRQDLQKSVLETSLKKVVRGGQSQVFQFIIANCREGADLTPIMQSALQNVLKDAAAGLQKSLIDQLNQSGIDMRDVVIPVLFAAIDTGDKAVVLRLIGHESVLENYGSNALIRAAEAGRKDLYDALIKKDVTKDHPQLLQEAFASAARAGQVDFLSELMKVERIADFKEAVLEVASNGQVDIIKFFIEVDRREMRDFLSEAVMSAAISGQKEVVQALCDAKVFLDFIDSEGRTPLMHAVLNNKPDVVRILLENGAAASFRDKAGQGRNAQDMAAGNRPMLDVIRTTKPKVSKVDTTE